MLPTVPDAADAGVAQRLIGDALPPLLVPLFLRGTAGADPAEVPTARAPRFRHATIGAARPGSLLLVSLSTFPVVIPFMLNQRREIGVAGLKCGGLVRAR
jgi:hypothetical protein